MPPEHLAPSLTDWSIPEDQTVLIRAQASERLRLFIPFRDFVIANEESLRRIAAYSTQLRWILWYVDFVVRSKT